jgi:hypothetical protein
LAVKPVGIYGKGFALPFLLTTLPIISEKSNVVNAFCTVFEKITTVFFNDAVQ